MPIDGCRLLIGSLTRTQLPVVERGYRNPCGNWTERETFEADEEAESTLVGPESVTHSPMGGEWGL